MNTEIKRHQSDLRQIVKQFKFHTQSLQNGVSNLDFVHLISVIERCSAKQVQNWNNTHSRKLHNLLLKNNCSVLDSDRVIFNFTNTQLTDAEKSLLTKGLNFCIPLSSLKYDDFLVPFEKLNRLLSKEPIWSANPDSRYVFKSNFKDLAISSFYSFNPKHIPQNLTNAEIAAFRNLRKRKDIIIVKPDKGNGVVILPREEYTSKMETILSDTSKFQRIGNIKNCLNHTLSLEQKVRKFLTDLFKQNVIDKETHDNLRPTGTAPGVLYGLPKVHKANHPLRPILSAINTVGYNISKFLVPILGCLTVNDYTVRDTFSFVNEIQQLTNCSKLVMASFDVESLFTNIPLDETISIITNNLFSENDFVSGFNKAQFKELLELSVKNTQFIFNDVLYQQIDGVGMGLPLGPTMANAFMCHYEKIWLSNCPSDFRPVFYRRYVDDTFLLFHSTDHVNKFLEYLNSQHPNIRFTCEHEVENQISFLDILISRSNEGLITSVYRKPTFTGQLTNYNSFTLQDYKINLIQCLLYRAYKISANWKLFKDQIDFITAVLKRNQFPVDIITATIHKWLQKNLSMNAPVSSVQRRLIYFSLPYTGYTGLQLRKNLRKLFQKNFPHLNIRIIFKTGPALRNWFTVKERLPKLMRSNIVYKYQCGSCSATYYGETTRHFTVRIHEHLGKSFRTNKPISVTPSAVLQHIRQTGHTSTVDNFSIISSANNNFELLLKESLLIHRDRPSLNNQVSSVPLSLF